MLNAHEFNNTILKKSFNPILALRTTLWASAVKPKPNLLVFCVKSGSQPQFSHSPFSITARASFKEAIFIGEFSITVSADASVWGTSSKCWNGVSMNSPSISTYQNELRWLTMYSSSPWTVTIFPLTGYFSFWWSVEVTAPTLWIHGRPPASCKYGHS